MWIPLWIFILLGVWALIGLLDQVENDVREKRSEESRQALQNSAEGSGRQF